MKLASRRNGTRDGELIVVSRDSSRYACAEVVPSLQAALDDWDAVAPTLREVSERLESEGKGKPLNVYELAAPLPRASEWLDGSAYLSHIERARKARGAPLPPSLKTEPLMYQGGSGALLAGHDPVVLQNAEWGLDLEAELGCLLSAVPCGADIDAAAASVRLFTLINDWTFRNLVPNELAKGFGFLNSKPSTAFAPFAVTPDELGDVYRDGRLHLRLRVFVNDALLGELEGGPEMHFSFLDLIVHAARTRSLGPGTIIGSGTVSNASAARGFACIAEKRMLESDAHESITPFLRAGDAVRIEAIHPDGSNAFGSIEQTVVDEAPRATSSSQSKSDGSARVSMPTSSPCITGFAGVHYYVHDLERSRRFYVDAMDFAEVAQSSSELATRGRQRSKVFRAGDCTVVCSAPLGEGGRAARYLAKHPDGVGSLVFDVRNIDGWFQKLDHVGGTPLSEVQTFQDDAGTLATFSITTPFGDTTFRFVERKGYAGFFPGIDWHAQKLGGNNAFGFGAVDHITSNFQTMSPALLWMEHVLGFERFWGIEFHTLDVAVQRFEDGSGLRSIVMRDPNSGIKFANNEPYRPFFKQSQINVFNEDHRGDGVQHIALSTPDIISAVRGLRQRGVEFMSTPGTYYDALPLRLEELGIGAIEESIETLQELGILLDGSAGGRYLLQIFLQDSAGLYHERDAGPFFFEIIQRKGDKGFGAGNFRALFESIEREQMKDK